MTLSKSQRGKMEETEKLEGQFCESNVQNKDEHIVPTRIMRLTIKPPIASQTTGAFSKVYLFCN